MPPTRRQKSKEKTPLLQVIEGCPESCPEPDWRGWSHRALPLDRYRRSVPHGLEGPTIHNLPSDEVPVGGYKYVRG